MFVRLQNVHCSQAVQSCSYNNASGQSCLRSVWKFCSLCMVLWWDPSGLFIGVHVIRPNFCVIENITSSKSMGAHFFRQIFFVCGGNSSNYQEGDCRGCHEFFRNLSVRFVCSSCLLFPHRVGKVGCLHLF